MPIRELPARPDLEHLKKQARDLLRGVHASEPEALGRFAAFSVGSTLKLADALHVVAREYGFHTWAALKLHVEMASAEPFQALGAAVKAGDAVAVREVLTRHASLRARINEPLPNYGFGEQAIVAAANKQNRAVIEVLVEFGADVHVRTQWWAGGFGVLDYANPELSAYLIERGATVDLHAAARLGMVDRVRELLTADPALVRARGGDGQFPLHYAATVEIAAMLLDAGAEIDGRDIDHESTAVQYMVSAKPYRHEVARFLIARGAKADIFVAAAIGDLGLAEQILDDDPDTSRMTVSDRYFPKENPESGGAIYIFGFGWTRTPHMIANQFGHADVFALLMQRSPVWLRLINAAEVGDESAFQRIFAGHPEVMKKLSLNARRIIGVATRNSTGAMHLLLGAGWPATPAMETGQTALHFAAFHGNAEMVRNLLEHGAEVNVFESEHGGSPLAWTLYGSVHGWYRDGGDYPAVVKMLLAAGAKVPESEQPLTGTEEVLEIVREHAARAGG
ncbi:ankyrin repeat domain-containing protein [Granulicella sibirica]|uniref:Ankyrin 1 n=1 Tax=Granulicella sibirica TaxID=2479048 RepID=A0A4Q0SX03_9BACT|nr:ankyrin repeat domain-containing protein [Granulicella sibirica]RXH55347.1 Ankyrin 1 [Granulicella sibirica]